MKLRSRSGFVLAVATCIVVACVTPKLAPEGGNCAVVADCEPGLVCAPSGDKRVCTTDLTGLGDVPTGSEDSGATPTDGGNDAGKPPAKDGGKDSGGGTTGGTTGSTTGADSGDDGSADAASD
jgi:hypothetical protein